MKKRMYTNLEPKFDTDKLTQFLRIVLPQYPPDGITHEGRAAIQK